MRGGWRGAARENCDVDHFELLSRGSCASHIAVDNATSSVGLLLRVWLLSVWLLSVWLLPVWLLPVWLLPVRLLRVWIRRLSLRALWGSAAVPWLRTLRWR